MISKEQNTEFLNKLANILSGRISPVNTVNAVNKIFKSYLNFESTEFIIWDNNSMLLKDFVQDWKIYDNETSSQGINYIYNNLAMENGKKFYFNDEEFDCNLDEEAQYRILELKSDDNNIIFPLVANGDVFGLLNITS